LRKEEGVVAVQAVLEQALLALAAVVAALALQEREADKEARAPPRVLVAPQLEAGLRPVPSAAGRRLELSVAELRDPRQQLRRPPDLSLLQLHQATIPRRAAV
jgi:hypothetical protein